MWRSTIGILTVVICLGWCTAWSQEKGNSAAAPKAGDSSGAPYKRIVYLVKQGTAKGLADALGKHFKGEDVVVQTPPEGPGNLLLIRTTPGTFAEVVRLLDKLDRRPRLVTVQLLVAEVMPLKAEPGQAAPPDGPLDETQFNGTMEEAQARIKALVRAGRVGAVKRLQITAVENQESHVLLGETKPFVAAARVLPNGVTNRSITYRNTGLSVTVTPHVAADNTILVDLRIQDSRPHVPADGIEIGADEKGTVRATEFIQSKLEAKLAIAPRRAVFARGVKTTSKSGSDQTLVIVGAQLVDGEAGPAKQPETNPPRKSRRPARGGILPSP
jgi:type II secretory pathway component GspD/PulD (secretin)